MAIDLPGVAGRVALSLGALALGAAAGAAAERVVMRLSATPESEADLDEFFSLSGEKHEVFTSDGVILHAEIDRHPSSDVTIVMPHGFALSRHSWYYQRLVLRHKATLVFYDQRGHGDSGYRDGAEKRDHSIDQLGRDLYSVIEQLVPQGDLILIGHSMGGMSILALVDQHPELVRERVIGVALIASAAASVASSTLGLPAPIARLVQKQVPNVMELLSGRGDIFARSRWNKSDLGLLLTRLYSFGSVAPIHAGEFVAEMISRTNFNVLIDFLPNLYSHDKSESLAPLHGIETLLIVGESDRLTPPEQSHAIVNRVPGADLVVLAESGHMVTIERHEEVNSLLIEFVDKILSARTSPAIAPPSAGPRSGLGSGPESETELKRAR